MSRKVKDILIREIFYLIISEVIVMLVVVGRGVLFGEWYKEYDNIFLAGLFVYVFLLILRGLIKLSRRMRNGGY